jgi:mono/diheme cytochrome c family protein
MADGSGVPNLNAPLTGSAYVKGDDAKLIEIVLKGSEALKGETTRTYRNVMASMAQLSDDQIADVLTYIRASFGNNSTAIPAGEVKAVREKLN